MLYGIFFGGLMFLLSEYLGNRLYALPEVGKYLRLYALLIPILYCDAITDAMIKGMGQQAVSVRYNILTNTLDLIFLYLLLPRYGMTGYFISFTATHMVNFILSLRRLLIITNQRVPAHVPLLSLSACIISCWAVSHAGGTFFRLLFFPPLLVSLLFLLGVIQREDFQWLNGLIQKNDPP